MSMQFALDKDHKDTLFEQAYFQLLTALHMGKVRPGDRLPSIRQVARRNGINLKTAFAIYRRLQDEGYVTLRTGSGAYVSDVDEANLEQAYCLSIFKTIRSNITEAGRLKVSPREYAKLVQGYVNKSRLKSARVAVVECNDEQINIFAHDISCRVGIIVQPLLLSRLESPDRRTASALSRVDYIATTHFHFKQVSALTAKYQKKLLQLSLNPAFITKIIEAARRGPVVMMVSNADYFPAFCESLLQTGTPPAVVGRITAADHTDLDRARFLAARAQTVYVSPIASPSLRELHHAHTEELKFDSTLSGESLEMLEAIILFSPKPS
jgi:DNA-binding transcriptional regulator YhcF (GntR family)